MSITKAQILTFTNAVLARSDGANDIDTEIQLVLDDLSRGPYIEAEDTTQTLTSTSTYLTFPTLFFTLGTIRLNDGSNWLKPLKPLRGGWKEYLDLIGDYEITTVSHPVWYAQWNQRFYLYPVPGSDYTTEIEYYKLHAQSVETIEFNDEFIRAIKFGAAFEVATRRKIPSQIEIWGSRYQAEKEILRLTHPGLPSVAEPK